MGGRVDLHIHSDRSSDGSFSPKWLVELAGRDGFKAISISDHDTVAAYPEALQAGESAGVEVIPSIEVTTLFKNREFHLLLPFIDWKKNIVKDLVNDIAERRMLEAKARVNKLQDLGFDLSWEEVVESAAPFPPLGVTIAQFLLKRAHASDDAKVSKYLSKKNRLYAPYLFYQDYFMEGKPAWVPRLNIKLLNLLENVSETDGVPVLAHPGAYFQKTTEDDLAVLKEKGLVGLEVYTSYHDKKQVHFYRSLAEKFDLVATTGSDFHGEIKPHIAFGAVNCGDYSMVEELIKRKKS